MAIIDDYADSMLNKIDLCIKDSLKATPVLRGAIVCNVNADSTVDVYLPPDRSKVFTRISNQTPFILNVGDSVEVMLKDGNWSNCWIIAKHRASYPGKK